MTSSEESPPLETLIARSALGDRAAFAALYDATSAKLFGVLLRILKNRPLAEDALQDVYVKIWRNAKHYHDAKGSVMTWLLSIARYRAIDLLRRNSARVQTSDRGADVVARTATADPGPERLSDHHQLNHCLEQLEPSRRTCVVLAYCEGYTHEELSRRTGSPVGTVKSWIRRSLQVLKHCLGDVDG